MNKSKVPIDIVEAMYKAMVEAHGYLHRTSDTLCDIVSLEKDLHDSFRAYEKRKELDRIESEKPTDIPVDRLMGLFANAWRKPENREFMRKFFIPSFESEKPVEDAKLLADIYLKELEDCIMSKTRHDSFSGESYDITSLNYPRSKIILYNFAERYHQSQKKEK